MTPPLKKPIPKKALDSPNLGMELRNGRPSIEKMLIELEEIRKLQVKEAVQARVWKMGEELAQRYQEEQNKEELIARERAAETMRQETALLAKLRHEEHLAATRHQQLTLEHEQSTKRMNEMLKEMEKKQKEAEEEEKKKFDEKKALLNMIYECQMSFRSKYQQISDASKSCKDRQSLIPVLTLQAGKLRSLCEEIELLVKKCKTGDVKVEDGEKASIAVAQLDSILTIILEEVGKINAKFEAGVAEQAAAVPIQPQPEVKAADVEAVRQEEETKEIKSVESAPENNPASKSSAFERFAHELRDCVDVECLKRYLSLQNYLKVFERSYEPLFADERWKKFRIDCQKAVSTPVNAISPVSTAHMMDKLARLRLLLTGRAADIGDTRVTSSAHPNGIAYCKNLLAKKLVKQGEQTVSSKPDAAFAIAAVIVALWNEFPNFGHLLLAHFHKECPYLVPFYIPQREGQSDEDYYKALGYRYSDDGVIEKQDKFLKRMSGIMRLYAAILVSRQMRQFQNKPHPHGVANGWSWMAATLNLRPQPDICASLLFDFLEVAGNGMATHYGSQFQKLLHITCKEYYPRLKEVTPVGSGGPVTRLQEFLQKTLRNGGFIPPPEALLSQPMW